MTPRANPGRLVVAVFATVIFLGALVAAAVFLLSLGGVLLLGGVVACVALLWIATPSTITMPTADTIIRGTWGIGPFIRAPWYGLRAVWAWADESATDDPGPQDPPRRHQGVSGAEPPPRRW